MRPIAHYTAAQQDQLAPWMRVVSKQAIFMDAPEHARLRGLLMRAFSPEAIERLIPRIGGLFSELLDRVPRGTKVDFISTVAQPFPALVIGEVLGIPRSGWNLLLRWCDVFMDFFASVPAPFELALEAQKAVIEMIEYVEPIVERRKAQPCDDLISMMLEVDQETDTITMDELLAQSMLLLVAGYETMRNLLGNSLFTLLTNPGATERVQHDSTLLRGAVAEILRFHGPVQGISRVAADPLELNGDKVEPGQALVVLVAAANRDPRQFRDPDHFDIERRNDAHLTFGAGRHTCLGNYLARLEAQIALSMLLRRYEHIELCDPRPRWSETLLVRGPRNLDIVFE